MAFNDRIQTVLPATKVRDVKTGINLKTKVREGDTIIYDAVDSAIKKMKKIMGRRAIVLFSDGEGVGIKSREDNLRDAMEQEASIYTIKFGTYASEPPKWANRKYYFERIEEIESYMRDLAGSTGGRPYHAEQIADLNETFRKVAEELGRQYTLGYYPTVDGKDGERRKITVKVNVPNVAVRSRNEVIYKKSKK